MVSALAGAVGAVVSDLATTVEHGATDAIYRSVYGNSGDSAQQNGPELALGYDQGMGCDEAGWVFPFPAARATVQPQQGTRHGGHTWDEDPAAFGAVTADPVVLNISATGKLDHAVLLTALKFHVTSRRPPLRGVIQNYGSGCGGGGTYRYGDVDLGSAAPYWVPGAGLPKDVRASAIEFPYKVTANDPEILMITVRTSGCDCTWYAELDWVDGTHVGRTLIKDHGRYFRTTSTAGLTSVRWPDPTSSPEISTVPSASR
ncbi:hypothetical protein ACIPX0_18560 [Streptomyces sp. NPDC090075]|uniref:hypothetical protein n=1 Tax=Streptomyces sp. NPDC090075 TaxID=3365937 RepID=UPI00380ADA01